MYRLLLWMSVIWISTYHLTAQADQYAPGPDVNTYYQTFGEGPALLIINGGPGFSSEGFVSLAKILAQDRRVILYDQRATGKSKLSPVNRTTITLDLMVQDIENLREHLNIERWTILGHSFGGMLAAHYAARYPESIQGLIMSSSGGVDLRLMQGPSTTSHLSPAHQDAFQYWTRRIREGDTTSHARLQRATYLAHAYVYDKTHLPVVAQRLTQGDLSLNSLVWADMQRINFDCKAALRSFQRPVLVIQGKNDVLGLDIAQSIDETFPNSRLVLLDQCGHYGWLDQPTHYFSAIREFLADTPVRE